MKIYDEWVGGNVNYFVYDVYDAVADDGCGGGDGAMEEVVVLVMLSGHHRPSPVHQQGHDGVHDGCDDGGYRDYYPHGGGHDNR